MISGFSYPLCFVLAACLASIAAGVQIDLVPVGDPGNAPDMRYATPGYGAVNYTFHMGKFEITAGQYAEFLNAIAADDTFALYDSGMVGAGGCNIVRTGSPGGYAYSVAPDWANRPVNYISWADAARFCNWLANEQPSGQQDASTTESGSYQLNGANMGYTLNSVVRSPDATFVIPNVDEWFKAAYYDGEKADYWRYATRSDTLPSNVLSATGTNNANIGADSLTLGPPYYRTDVGAFAASRSCYGTFDQTGNVFEWEENASSRFNTAEGHWEYFHAMTGGFYGGRFSVGATDSYEVDTLTNTFAIGFRVALVPEPSSILVLLPAYIAVALRRASRRSRRTLN
jgi:formylglycine-generating enzyme required for sulfatase activity